MRPKVQNYFWQDIIFLKKSYEVDANNSYAVAVVFKWVNLDYLIDLLVILTIANFVAPWMPKCY